MRKNVVLSRPQHEVQHIIINANERKRTRERRNKKERRKAERATNK